MKSHFLVIAFFILIHSSYGKDAAVGDVFLVSLPGSTKEHVPPERLHGSSGAVLQKYGGASFQLHIYRWRNVRADGPLGEIPEQWSHDKDWASVSDVSERQTDSGIPYVMFKTRIAREGRPPFESVMAVFRSPHGEAFMFQFTGDKAVIDAICNSVRTK